jgi:hypothetical protein
MREPKKGFGGVRNLASLRSPFKPSFPMGGQISPEGFRGEIVTTDLALLQGTLDILVLETLSWGPRRGYAVARCATISPARRATCVDPALALRAE